MKIFFLTSLILIIAAPYCYAEISQYIDNEKQKCLDTNFQSDYTMAQCNYDAILKYNNEMQKLMQKLKKILTKAQYSALTASQYQWELYIKNDNKLLANTLESKFYFEPYLISSEIKFQNYKQRYQELSDIYKYLKN